MLTKDQEQQLHQLKQHFPFRIVFGVVHKETEDFSAYTKTTMHTANHMARQGHAVFVYGNS